MQIHCLVLNNEHFEPFSAKSKKTPLLLGMKEYQQEQF